MEVQPELLKVQKEIQDINELQEKDYNNWTEVEKRRYGREEIAYENLREKKQQLREKKQQLMKKETQLMKKEEQLREKELILLRQQQVRNYREVAVHGTAVSEISIAKLEDIPSNIRKSDWKDIFLVEENTENFKFIDRDEEMSKIMALLKENWFIPKEHRVSKSNNTIIGIHGAPGMGKSRMLREVTEVLLKEDAAIPLVVTFNSPVNIRTYNRFKSVMEEYLIRLLYL
jgi:ATPase subunit of ABC transporter with duplicated ATPase domains